MPPPLGNSMMALRPNVFKAKRPAPSVCTGCYKHGNIRYDWPVEIQGFVYTTDKRNPDLVPGNETCPSAVGLS